MDRKECMSAPDPANSIELSRYTAAVTEKAAEDGTDGHPLSSINSTGSFFYGRFYLAKQRVQVTHQE